MRPSLKSSQEIRADAGGFRSVSVGAGALALLVGLVAGVPLVLVVLVGNPLPSSAPSWVQLSEVIDSGALPSGVLVKVVACFVWFWWLQLAISTVSEVTARLRDRDARRLPFGGFGTQKLVVRLIAVVMATLISLGAATQPAAASPSFEGVTVDARRPVSSAASEMLVETAPEESIIFPPASSETMPPDVTLEEDLREQVIDRLRSVWLVGATAVDASKGASDRLQPVAAVAAASSSAGVVSVGVSSSPEVSAAASAVVGLGQDSSSAAPSIPRIEVSASAASSAADALAGAADEVRDTPAWVIVQPGDTLWSLAETHLGDPNRWSEIFDLNAGGLSSGGVLSQPNVIHPGWRLKLPSPQEVGEMSTPRAGQAESVLRATEPTTNDATLTPLAFSPDGDAPVEGREALAEDGVTGETGETMAVGVTGETMAVGVTGETMAVGETGETMAVGEVGEVGEAREAREVGEAREADAENFPLLYPPGHSSLEVRSLDLERSTEPAPRLFPPVLRPQAEGENQGNLEA